MDGGLASGGVIGIIREAFELKNVPKSGKSPRPHFHFESFLQLQFSYFS